MSDTDRIQAFLERLPTVDAQLTVRQAQATDGVVRGLTAEAIAGELGVTVRTVNHHIEQAMRVTCTATRTDLALWQVSREFIAILASSQDDEICDS
jgi:DNA-binding NarL/FixJ family response regulator